MAITSAWIQRPTVVLGENCSRQTSGRLRPVAMPSFADNVWISLAIRFEATITQTKVKPNFDPPAMFVAKFPGSTYATHAMNAGPRKGSRRQRVSPEPRRTCSPAPGRR